MITSYLNSLNVEPIHELFKICIIKPIPSAIPVSIELKIRNDSPVGRLTQKFRLGAGAGDRVSPLRAPFSVSLCPAGVDLRQGAPAALLPVEVSARHVDGHHLGREVARHHALLLLGRGQQVLQVDDA